MVLTRRQTAGLLAPLVASSGTLPGLKPATAASTPSALPFIGLGTCCDDADTAERLVLAGLEAGYRLIDTAAHYDSEPAVGAALAAAVDRGVLRRSSEVTVCTKVWFSDMGYDATIASARRSLERLREERLGLLLIHFPGSPDAVQDPKRNRALRASTWRALEDLQRDGLVRDIGVSNWSRRHLREMLATCRTPPAVLQTELHPRCQQPELREDCDAAGIKVLAHCPLAHGAASLLRDPTLCAVADRVGRSAAQVALRWSVQSGVVPLPHGSSAARLRENLAAAADDFELDAAAMASLASLDAEERQAFNPALIA